MTHTHNVSIVLDNSIFVNFEAGFITEDGDKFSFVRVDADAIPNPDGGLIAVVKSNDILSYRYDKTAIVATIKSIEIRDENNGCHSYRIEAFNTVFDSIIIEADAI